jgi:hypothetical protein
MGVVDHGGKIADRLMGMDSEQKADGHLRDLGL